MKIFVALSGGVDSTVVAHLLMQAGHDVTGVFIRVWQPDFIACSQDEEERSAKRACAHLGIAFRRLDLSETYKREVVDAMVSEYKRGRTPNPDVLCNRYIKFDGLWEYAKAHGAEKIATGHHAYITEHDNVFSLHRGIDDRKDQSYFLWKLAQEDLSHTLMPIGTMNKQAVRSYARMRALPSAYKPDSQGLCFIGHIDLKTFLSHFMEQTSGTVINESGMPIGTCDALEYITLGQRSGFTLTNKDNQDPHYVVAKDMSKRTITVSSTPLLQAHTTRIPLINASWMHIPNAQQQYTCQLRYHGTKRACTIEGEEIILREPVHATPGQSVVVYDATTCLGGGIVA